MSAATLLEPTPPGPPADDPFVIGYRYVHSVDAAGKKTSVMVPLSEEDFLHPQEGDRFMLTDVHSAAVDYLRHAIRFDARERPALRVLSEHRIDWQVGGIPPHGPDVAVFDRFPTDWPGEDATLRVADLNVTALAVIEVTSDATRHVDFGPKFDEYLAVGIPYYIVIDLAAPNGVPAILGFRKERGRYREMRRDPKLGFMVPALALWFRLDGNRVIVADEDGRDIPDSPETGFQIADLSAKADTAQKQAEAEKQRADVEKQRADAEKQRADDLARELADLKARLN